MKYAVTCRIMTFQATTDRIHNGGDYNIIVQYYNIIVQYYNIIL